MRVISFFGNVLENVYSLNGVLLFATAPRREGTQWPDPTVSGRVFTSEGREYITPAIRTEPHGNLANGGREAGYGWPCLASLDGKTLQWCDGRYVLPFDGQQVGTERLHDLGPCPGYLRDGYTHEEHDAWDKKYREVTLQSKKMLKTTWNDTHVVMNGCQLKRELSILVGPTRAEPYLSKKSLKSKHVIIITRGGEPRPMKLEHNPIHVEISEDGLSVWAVCGSAAYQIDLDI